MKKLVFILFLTTALILIPGCGKTKVHEPSSNGSTTEAPESNTSLKDKVLYVNSYHADFPWSAGIEHGILSIFDISSDPETGELDNSNSRIDLRIYNMNTKNDPSSENMTRAVDDINRIIREWEPQLVIASEDNASKFLIKPYYINSTLPFIFCGVNWDASVYGFPAENITGMIEVSLIPQLVEELSHYADGTEVAYLKGESLTAQKEAEYFEKALGYSITKAFASSFAEWQEMFIQLQDEVDILLTAYPSAMNDWDGDEKRLHAFMNSNTRIPTGAWDIWLSDNVLITMANVAEEQGEWAAKSALEILEGKKPSEIPVVTNSKAAVYLNMALAKQLSIEFPMELILQSHMVNTPK